jgi:spore germination protein KA
VATTSNSAQKGMFSFLKSKFINIGTKNDYNPTAGSAPEYTKLKESLLDNMIYIQGSFDGCADFVRKDFLVCGHSAIMLEIDNMVDKMVLSESVLNPLVNAQKPAGIIDDDSFFDWIRDCVLSSVEQKEVFSYEELIDYLMQGFAVLLIDGVSRAIAVGLQGYKLRSIEEPSTEKVLRGSREGFVEPLQVNMMLVRRRIKNPNLKFEVYTLGSESKTKVCIAYIKGIANDKILEKVRQRLQAIDINTIFASGYIQSFFSDNPSEIFSTVGTTERPDTFCGRLNEGRVGILVDNTPTSLTMPYLFVENFQNMDDYAVGSYYATFTRILKYIAFFVSVLAPAFYVAIGSFHQALLPSQLLYALAKAEESTPFPLTFEALFMQLIYEIIREAGLRLPKQIGFAISIVGALLVGQAAVDASLIGAPMVIIVAITATTSLVVPTLYESGVILRFLYIILAGMAGIYGFSIGIVFTAFYICSLKSYDVPYTSPISPFNAYASRDVVIRAPWQVLAKRKVNVDDMPASEVKKQQL